MSDVTQVLQQIESGDPSAAEQLLPLVYYELRKLAAVRMASESPDHTLQPTALVHEAYLRLVDVERAQHWNSRGHFFAAAAEAMRRILVDSARRTASRKRGGDLERRDMEEMEFAASHRSDDVVAVDEALTELATVDAAAADLVKLRYFGGLTAEEAAEALEISPRTADRLWTFARSWLFRKLRDT
jgi:RNA polymerase sigma factor (TIGR02999 family)